MPDEFLVFRMKSYDLYNFFISFAQRKRELEKSRSNQHPEAIISGTGTHHAYHSVILNIREQRTKKYHNAHNARPAVRHTGHE